MAYRKIRLLALALALLACPAEAEQLSTTAPEARLMRGVMGTEALSENVSIYRVGVADLPQKIRGEIGSLLVACGGNTEESDKVIAFAWVSDWQRKQGSAPNYIFDFRDFKKEDKQAPCAGEPLCTEEGCLLLGYTGEKEERWHRTFSLRALDFGFVATRGANDAITQEIHVLSMKPDCESSYGTQTDKGCFRRFVWRDIGLSALPPRK